MTFCEQFSFLYVKKDSDIEKILKLKGDTVSENEKEKVFYIIHNQQNYTVMNGIVSLFAILLAISFFSICVSYIKNYCSYEVNHRFFYRSLSAFRYVSVAFFQKGLYNLHTLICLTVFLPVYLFNYNLYINKRNAVLNLSSYLIIMIVMNYLLYKYDFYSKEIFASQSKTEVMSFKIKNHVNDIDKMIILFNGPYLVALMIQIARWYYVHYKVQQQIKSINSCSVFFDSTETNEVSEIFTEREELEFFESCI